MRVLLIPVAALLAVGAAVFVVAAPLAARDSGWLFGMVWVAAAYGCAMGARQIWHVAAVPTRRTKLFET